MQTSLRFIGDSVPNSGDRKTSRQQSRRLAPTSDSRQFFSQIVRRSELSHRDDSVLCQEKSRSSAKNAELPNADSQNPKALAVISLSNFDDVLLLNFTWVIADD